MSIHTIIEKLNHKNILLLGFGKEGISSYKFIRTHLPQVSITIANQSDIADKSVFSNDAYTHLLIGEHYLETMNDYDIVLKSPGISLKNIISLLDKSKISSQTDLFLQAFSSQCIGITGTKGKSTTASLLYHILHDTGKRVLIAGNIGIPFFDIIQKITPDTTIVMEVSSHQLEFIRKSPHIGILLNLFEEHLDHYHSFSDYQQAKYNITRYQSPEDYFIYNTEDKLIANLLQINKTVSKTIGFSFSPYQGNLSYIREQYFCSFKNGKEEMICKITDDFPIKGNHNLLNTTAVIAALNAMGDVNPFQIEHAVYSFRGLPHRLELIGKVKGITFYNDSISTIPQASIAAIQSLKKVNTIILGGFDRGIDYQPLIDFLALSEVEYIIFTGNAGKRMLELSSSLKNKQLFFRNTYPEIVFLAKECTKKGSICLLSPAAASYDAFRNFEHRGDTFRELVLAE
ncbi:MAG: UDP-N-acetylmuramoyl-L-alanine--D-glutamate ligase [Bacteroidales bacterium]|jgi:UDP-N-acetylmuramoylalanine--D-glutamate ligase|nr:UDP-N-acetylmuramoyl-L-alanine--D-glutamate ligase [Bacteroidales bacterium]